MSAERNAGSRFLLSSGLAGAAAAMVAVLSTGCSQPHPVETGFSDQSMTQVQFFAPPGATVTVAKCCTSVRSHQIAEYGPFENRLERTPEEYSVFNLKPGRYEFKYISAEGLPGVSVYGELEVYYANTQAAQIFQRRSFVPITVPSEYYRRVEVNGDEMFPYRGEAYRAAIDDLDLQRLKQGDVIEKVFVVADLEKAERVRLKTEQAVAVCEREIEYADARFRLAYLDYRMDVADASANFWGTDRKFIKWEKERKELEQDLAKLEARLKRAKAVLKGDHVLVRKGMLVLATEEVVAPHRDVVQAADDIGEVVLVMRLGGRHMQWDDPRRELAVYQK